MTNVPNQPPPQAPLTPPPASDLSADVRNMAMLAHLLGIVGFIGPLIIWLIKKADHPFIDQEGKESLNWQLTLLIGWIGLLIVGIVLAFIPILGHCLRALLYFALAAGNLALCIIACTKASKGIGYRYPVNFRLIK